MSRYGTSGAICCLALSHVLACTPSRPPVARAPVPAGYPSDVVLTSVVATSTGSTRASPVSPASTVQPSRQVIRRGQIDVQVATLGTARERLERAVSASGAQVTRATVNERERAEYFIKVPPDRLDALMDSTAALGEVGSRSVGVEDVTERVIDAEARLASLRASRDRLRQLLERAATVQDVISVERELA